MKNVSFLHPNKYNSNKNVKIIIISNHYTIKMKCSGKKMIDDGVQKK